MSISTKAQAKNIIKRLHADKQIIVFTNGCFDIIHRGHIEYLSRARALGDVLIVGLNSDASVRRIKGKARPIQREEDRAAILNAFQMVDIVILFDEDTPLELISELKPDVLVKGGDYDFNSIVGAKEMENWGGIVKIIPFLKGYGTSLLVNSILKKKS